MGVPQSQQVLSRIITMATSVAALAVVWGVVWANMPTLEEIQSSPVASREVKSIHPAPTLDLTIPGVPSHNGKEPESSLPTMAVNGVEGPQTGTDLSARSAPIEPRARQIVEMKCDVEVEAACPQSMPGEDRRQCVEQRIPHLARPCQQILRQRLVRWKERSGQALACVEDVKRFCADVPSGEGRVLQCLQGHAQEVSDRCYATLPKGSLTYRH